MAQRTGLLLAAAVAVFALAGCAGSPGATEDSLEGNWVLTSGSDAAGAIEVGDATVTLGFNETTGGTAACNGYTAQIIGGPGTVSVRQITQTEMACVPASRMEIEQRYLAALGEVNRAEYEGSELVLTGPDVELRFGEGVAAVSGTFVPGDPDTPVTGCDDKGAQDDTEVVCPQ